jgi:hypothetical protein
MREVATEQAYTAAKKKLPAITFCGTFAPTRNTKHLVAHSGIIHGDIDHLGDVQQAKQTLSHDTYLVYCFISPSGDGLKLGVLAPTVTSDEGYKHAWQAVADYFAGQYGLTWDASGKDVCRLCFVSWDAELYCNPQPQSFPVPPIVEHHPPPPSRVPIRQPFVTPATSTERVIQAAVSILARAQQGTKHHALCRASFWLGGYVGAGLLDYEVAYTALEQAVWQYATEPDKAMRTLRDGLTAGMQKPVTPRAPALWHPLPPTQTTAHAITPIAVQEETSWLA